MLGRSLGGFLFGLGRAVPFVADALSFVLSFGAVAFMTGAPAAASVRSKDEDRSVRREILEGVRWVIENPFLRTDIVITVGLGISVHGLILAFTVNAQRFEVSPLWIGLTLATPGVGGVIGSAFAAWAYRKLGLSLIFIQTWLWAAIFVIPLFGVGVESIAVTLFIIGLIGSVGNVAVSTYTVQQAPHEMLGRVSSVGLMVMFGGTALGSLIGGLLITAIGVDGTVRILFALMMILASWATTVRAFRSPASLERLS